MLLGNTVVVDVPLCSCCIHLSLSPVHHEIHNHLGSTSPLCPLEHFELKEALQLQRDGNRQTQQKGLPHWRKKFLSSVAHAEVTAGASTVSILAFSQTQIKMERYLWGVCNASTHQSDRVLENSQKAISAWDQVLICIWSGIWDCWRVETNIKNDIVLYPCTFLSECWNHGAFQVYSVYLPIV